MAEDLDIDLEGFERRLAQYTEWLRVNHFSEVTHVRRALCLRRFFAWCAERGVTRPCEVTKAILERYQAALFHHRKPADGMPLALTTQQNYLIAVKGYFKWLARQNHILYNPASEILLPRLGHRLPKHVFTQEEAERVINAPDIGTPTGLRNRAILETLYSTGIRRMELVSLRLYDLDADRGTLRVREGKGRKDRVVPIGDRALAWVRKYLDEVRPLYVVPPDEGYIFLGSGGERLSLHTLTHYVRRYVKGAGIGKPGSAHLFRHTCATLMVENGADIRFVQAMLGHAQLSTTAIYTQVSIKKLKEVHTATHPADRPHAEAEAGVRPAPEAATPPAAARPLLPAAARPSPPPAE